MKLDHITWAIIVLTLIFIILLPLPFVYPGGLSFLMQRLWNIAILIIGCGIVIAFLLLTSKLSVSKSKNQREKTDFLSLGSKFLWIAVIIVFLIFILFDFIIGNVISPIIVESVSLDLSNYNYDSIIGNLFLAFLFCMIYEKAYNKIPGKKSINKGMSFAFIFWLVTVILASIISMLLITKVDFYFAMISIPFALLRYLVSGFIVGKVWDVYPGRPIVY